METYPTFSFFTVLIDSIKLIPKNGKLMALLALISIIIHWSLVFLHNYSIHVLIDGMVPIFMPNLSSFHTSNTSPFLPKTGFKPQYQLNPRLKKDFVVFITVEATYLLIASTIAFFSGVTAIIVAAASYVSQSLSLKELLSCLWRTWTRPVITIFYVLLMTVAYNFVVFMLATPLVIRGTSTTLAIAIIFVIVSLIYYIYLSIVWVFAIVISIVDETSSGLRALSKAGQLIKGKRLHAFFLNTIYIIFCLIVGTVDKRVFGNKKSKNDSTNGLFMAIVLCLARLFFAVAYTVLYFQCKKIHSEEIELYGNAPYKKIQAKEEDCN